MYVSSLFLCKKKWQLRTLLFSCWPRNLAFLPEWGGCSEQGTGCLFSLPPLVSARPRKTDLLGYSSAPSFLGSPICFGPWGKTSAAVAVVFPLSFIFRLAYVYLKFSWIILVASHLTFSIFSRPHFSLHLSSFVFHVDIFCLLIRCFVWEEILTNFSSVASILDFPSLHHEDSSGPGRGFLFSISFTPSPPPLFFLWPCTRFFPHLWVKCCHCPLMPSPECTLASSQEVFAVIGSLPPTTREPVPFSFL